MATVIKSIGTGKDYSTIAAWISSLSDGTYSSGDDVIGELYDSSYDEIFNIDDSGFAAGLDSITLRANAAEKHNGTPDSGVKITYTGAIQEGVALYNVSYDHNVYGEHKVKIEDIEFGDINITEHKDMHVFKLGDRNTIFSRCLVNNITSGAPATKRFRIFKDCSAIIQNTMIFNCGKVFIGGGVSANTQVFNVDNSVNAIAKNCTVYNIFDLGHSTVWGSFYGVYQNTIIAEVAVCFKLVSNDTNTNNLSSDSTAPGANAKPDKASQWLFVSTVQGSEDLHLKNNSAALRGGLDLGTANGVQYDIDGLNRDDIGGLWDIGADQCQSCRITSFQANKRLSLGFSVHQEVSAFNLSDF